ncbi:hypothetical protein [Bacillus atrophaeus]|uniref:hypothetical protein n=1 Tax=Bacillus atrophaeus TaxID=1452 RepID=UPI002E1DAAC3|nr:hypothetical protein [Bacillus atrophaeus]
MKEPVEKVEKVAKVEEQSVAKTSDIELTDKKIQEWKKIHGKVFKTTVGGEPYIWRKLKRREYVDIMSMIQTDGESEEETAVGNRIYLRQESIVRRVILFPADIEDRIDENAGLATSIADEVILKSGFDVAATEEL